MPATKAAADKPSSSNFADAFLPILEPISLKSEVNFPAFTSSLPPFQNDSKPLDFSDSIFPDVNKLVKVKSSVESKLSERLDQMSRRLESSRSSGSRAWGGGAPESAYITGKSIYEDIRKRE